MRLGVLAAGAVPPEFVTRFGEYPEIFARLYKSVDPSVEIDAYHVHLSVLPDRPDACDAWVVSGSKHGVYDDLPWIGPLKAFLRSARTKGVPMIGVCFGHQIMAEAFGGKAEKSAKGWGCGIQDYRVTRRPAWFEDAADRFTMHAMHQDQVTAIPDDASVLATSDFCEYAMLSYGDPDAPDAISIQPHPEFERDYAKGLLEMRSGVAIPENLTRPALAQIDTPVDGEAFARWSLRYLDMAMSRRHAA